MNDLRERASDPFSSMGFGGFPSMPSLFDSGRAAVVAPPPEPFSENGTNYVRHSFALAFRASRRLETLMSQPVYYTEVHFQGRTDQ